MIIDTINLNHIRIFECVYRTKSMTKAAEQLHMTQSGVSQHIKVLEEILEIKLFDRIKQRLVPTSKAQELFEECSQGLYRIENSLRKIKNGQHQLSGKISIGLPIEFGNNVILPLLSKFGHENQDISYKIRYGYASEMNGLLLKGDIDFALIDAYAMDSQIQTINIYDELLYLCSSKKFIINKKIPTNKKEFESLEYISYVDSAELLQMWFKHHYQYTNMKLKLKGTLMDVQGVARMICADSGIGILPLHLITQLEKNGHDLYKFKGSGKVFTNTITLAYVKERTLNLAISSLIDFLKKNATSIKKDGPL